MRLIADPRNTVYLSAVVAWEIAIKSRVGRLPLKVEPVDFVATAVSQLALVHLDVNSEHALATLDLPLIHNDPFDRLLIAQARIEGLTLVTADPLVKRYDVATVW